MRDTTRRPTFAFSAFLAFLAFLAFFLVLPAIAGAAVPIAAVRDLPLGSVVTIEGRVTVPPGLFESASLEDQGFVLRDATGGIYVNIDTRLDIRLHQKIQVTGMLEEIFNIRFVATTPEDVHLVPVGPLMVPTGEVGAATEGNIITVSGVVTEEVFDERPYGFQFPIDDGSGEIAIFVHASTGINPLDIPFIAVGEEIQVTGYSGRFSDEFEIQPRFRRDIRRAEEP